ncbi:unnamed protein product [Trifolium pratense]|uniref:Uncharacterized protein n=1 Tax=Trifolium pratense TaxID=57577 RepID=A0ACB0M426_TRIPR|nr:unnamed protein product [Trifolium pratense]
MQSGFQKEYTKKEENRTQTQSGSNVTCTESEWLNVYLFIPKLDIASIEFGLDSPLVTVKTKWNYFHQKQQLRSQKNKGSDR